MITAATGCGTISNAHASVEKTSTKWNWELSNPSFEMYELSSSGFDSSGNHLPASPSFLDDIIVWPVAAGLAGGAEEKLGMVESNQTMVAQTAICSRFMI